MGRVVAFQDIATAVEAERAAGRGIVLTNGCFDLLHVGHVRLLQRCRALGDVLVVGVNDDTSVQRLKGPARPLVPAAERAEVLAALEAVDYVTVFEETTAERLAAAVRPEVYVKGADYAQPSTSSQRPDSDPDGGEVDDDRLPEARVVRQAGGRVVLLPLTPGRSTSALVGRIAAGEHQVPNAGREGPIAKAAPGATAAAPDGAAAGP